jgi:hypothetical protein
MKNCIAGIVLLVLSAAAAASESARVYIIAPQDGAQVEQTFTVQFGLSGMGVAPAGIDKANTGHHHLLIDGDTLPPAGQAMGSNVKHFGGGQTETTLTLPAGTHTLQLIMGDKNHVPLEPMVASEKITVIVK